jgi:hypothetical protein
MVSILLTASVADSRIAGRLSGASPDSDQTLAELGKASVVRVQRYAKKSGDEGR